MVGGFLAGIGGSFLSLFYPGSWNEGLSSGQGITAVALVIFARWDPLLCLWASLAFGGAAALGPALQSVGVTSGYHLFNAAPYILTLAIMSTYSAKWYQGRYIQGLIAAKMSKSGVLGYIGSFPIPEVVSGINATILAAQTINPNIKVKIIWANTWFDPGKEADAAKALIDQGADVIMQKSFAILGATLIAAVTIQTAAASDRHHVRKAHPAPVTQSVRNSNATMWPSQPTEPDWSRYANGAMSAPAGR